MAGSHRKIIALEAIDIIETHRLLRQAVCVSPAYRPGKFEDLSRRTVNICQRIDAIDRSDVIASACLSAEGHAIIIAAPGHTEIEFDIAKLCGIIEIICRAERENLSRDEKISARGEIETPLGRGIRSDEIRLFGHVERLKCATGIQKTIGVAAWREIDLAISGLVNAQHDTFVLKRDGVEAFGPRAGIYRIDPAGALKGITGPGYHLTTRRDGIACTKVVIVVNVKAVTVMDDDTAIGPAVEVRIQP